MPFIDIEELPKTKGRFVDLDERPSQTFFKAGKEVSEQDFLSPGKLHIQSPLLAAAKGASDVIGGPFAPNYYASRIPRFLGGQGLAHPEAMRHAEEVSKPLEEAKIEGIPGQVGYGLAQVAPILAGAPAPFMAGAKGLLGLASKIPLAGKLTRAPIAKTALGFGGYEAAKGLVGGETDIAKSFGGGVVGGAGYHAGLRGGATLGKMLLPTKIAERVGSAAGAGAVGALTAPEGEKISSVITGAGFGAKYPGRAFGYKTPVELSKQAVDIYRNILRPTQSETQLIEVRKGKDLDNYFRLAAEENLPIKKTSENKLDTDQAREILQTKIRSTQSELDKILEKDTTNYFDLLKIGQQARKNAREQISNAKELEGAIEQINDYISAEIARHKGRTVSAVSLNKVKQGMWSVGYDALRPTSQENARRIGFAAKDAIEKAYPNNIVRTLNERSGDYITLSRLLEKAHGRVIQKGRIGGYAARGTGLIIGGAAGQLIPIPGVGMAAGAWAGQKIGGKVNEYLSSPERLSRVAGKKMAESKSAGKEQLLDVAFKNLTKSPVFIPKAKSFFTQAPGKVGAKLKGKSGQAVFGRKEPQEPVFGVKPQEALKTVADVEKMISEKSKVYGSRNGFLASDEYKKLYPQVEKIYAENKNNFVSKASKALEENNIKIGDRVSTLAQGFSGGESVSGTVISKEGIPYVKLDSPQMTQGGYKKQVQWHKGWRKSQELTPTPIQKPIAPPAKDLQGKPGIVEPLTAAEAVKQGIGAEVRNKQISKAAQSVLEIPNTPMSGFAHGKESIIKTIPGVSEHKGKSIDASILQNEQGKFRIILHDTNMGIVDAGVLLRKESDGFVIENIANQETIKDAIPTLKKLIKENLGEIIIDKDAPRLQTKSQLLSEYEAAKGAARQNPLRNKSGQAFIGGGQESFSNPQGMDAERMREVYNLSWNNLSKKIPENYDNLVIPEIEKALQRTKGDVIRNKVYNYIIYEFNKGKSEGILDSINISSSEGTKKVYYKIGDKKIDVKLIQARGEFPGILGPTMATGVGLAAAGTLLAGQAQAGENIDIRRINYIESNNKEDEIGDDGKAFGINQIHEGTLSDYNKANKSSYTTKDLMNKSINNKVADWYFNKEIPRLLKHYKFDDTIRNRIGAYNFGIGNMKKGLRFPKTTEDYIKKYNSRE